MATRFIPVSICRVPDKIEGKNYLERTDDEVIADINRRLTYTDYKLQPLEPGQFVADLRRIVTTRSATATRPKSPRQLARAEGRVERMMAKTKKNVARRRARR